MKAKERAGINQSGGAIKYLGREPFVILASPLVMRVRTFLFITALMLCHLKLWPQTLTRQFPASESGDTVTGVAEPDLAKERAAAQDRQDASGSSSFPD